MQRPARVDQTAAVAALRDPTRRALFDAVARSDTPVSIDEVVRATGTPKSTAALHLDRLVELGVLAAGFERRSGRTGPGAGRPAKVYLAVGDRDRGQHPGPRLRADGRGVRRSTRGGGALEAEPSGSVGTPCATPPPPQGEELIREHGDLDRALDGGRLRAGDR